MRLARLDLTRYGKFTDGSLDFGVRQPGRPDLHIVYGPNEAGKSTAFSALLDLLFGIETQSDYAFLHPYRTMKVGGALELGGAAPKTFGRIKRPQNSLLDAADQPVGDAALLGGFGGLDRAAYRNMFSLDDETLEKGGQNILASKGDLGQLLFSASAGLADLSQTLDELRAETDRFFRGRAKSELADLKTQLDRLKSEREALDTMLPAYRKLVETSETSRARYETEMGQRTALHTRANAVDRLLAALPRFARLQALRDRAQPLRELPEPPAHWREDLPSLQREEIELATQIAGCAAEMSQLVAVRDGIVVDETVLRLADRIDDLGGTRDRFTGAEKDLPERRRGLADCDAELGKLLRRLERDNEADPDRLVLGASVLGALRDLIEQRSGIVGRLDTAQRQHADAERLHADAEAALAEVGGGPAEVTASLAPLRNLLAALRASDGGLRRRQAERARGVLGDSLDATLKGLRPWTGTIEQLGAGFPPAAADLAQWKQLEADLARDLARHATDLERLTGERQRLSTEQVAAGRFAGVVSEAEAAALRTRRDQAWAEHRRDLRAETADRFENALREDDGVTGARLHRGAETARLAQVGQALAIVEVDLAQATQRRDGAVEAQARLASELGAALQALGWPEAARVCVATLEDWLRRRADCLDQHGRMRDEDRIIVEAQAEEADACSRLAATLAAAGVGRPADAGFAELLAFAEALLDRDSASSGLRAQLVDRRRALADQTRELTAARTAETGWQTAWTQACAGCWIGETGPVPTVAAVRVILDALAELGPVLVKRADLSSRIDKMEADQARFAQEVARLAGELGLEQGSGSALDRASALAQRLAAARETDGRRRDLSARLAELDARRGQLGGAKAIHGKRAAAMLAFFAVESLTQVGERLDQARERADLARDAAEIEHEITAALGVSSLAEAEGALARADRAALEAERDDLRPRLEAFDQRTRDIWAEYTRASDAVAAVGGDDAVARIAETRRTVLLSMEDKALRYLRLRFGLAAAEQALRAYRDQHRSSMMSRASDAFRTISRGAYSGLTAQPGDKGDVLVALGADASKEAAQLSKGTRFQLYLALRVAGYYEYCLSREPVPFVADDIMETFDDFRAEEAFRLFAQMAEVGQVIYLTHHRHLCDIARSVCPDVRVTELPAAA